MDQEGKPCLASNLSILWQFEGGRKATNISEMVRQGKNHEGGTGLAGFKVKLVMGFAEWLEI